MTMTQQNAVTRRVRKIAIFFLSLFVLMAVLYGAGTIYDKFLSPQYLSDRYPPDVFERKPISTDDIARYLNDVTLILQYPSSNSVTYFGSDHHFIRWHSIDFHAGYWTTETKLQKRVYKDKAEWLSVQFFCKWYPDEPLLNIDNCVVAYQLSDLFAVYPSVDRVDGNPLGLSPNARPNFQLPLRGPISIQSLLHSADMSDFDALPENRISNTMPT